MSCKYCTIMLSIKSIVIQSWSGGGGGGYGGGGIGSVWPSMGALTTLSVWYFNPIRSKILLTNLKLSKKENWKIIQTYNKHVATKGISFFMTLLLRLASGGRRWFIRKNCPGYPGIKLQRINKLSDKIWLQRIAGEESLFFNKNNIKILW